MAVIKTLQTLTRADTLPCVQIATAVTILTLIYLRYNPAPYGKFTPKKGVLQAFQISGKIAWCLQECPSFLIPIHILAIYWKSFTITANVSLALFCMHYFQRSFVYPILITSKTKSPLSACMSALLFCCFNGWLQSKAIKETGSTNRNPILFSVGCVLFLIGMFINISSDSHLRNLSRKRENNQYLIPNAGLFKYVSAANYTGEIIEWIGFALTSQTPASLWFAFFSASFLGQRGYQCHQFYLHKIDDYPKDRSSVIPFTGF